MDWAWANYRPWTEKKGAAEEEDRKKSHPKLPPPFSLLCNLLIRFEWEPGSQHLRTGGGASLWGRMWGDATPPLSIAQSRGPSLPSSSTRRGGETRCYKPRPPRPRCVLSPVLGVICKRGPLSLLPCLVSPGASPPPCYGGVCAQGSRTQHCVPISPPAPGFAWENPSVSYAAGRCGLGRGRTAGNHHPDSRSASRLQAFQ